jgi:hypothetical protein
MGSTRKGRDIDAALQKKGFRCERDGKHIWYYFRESNGEDSNVKVMMSHGMMGSSLSAKLIGDMARQLHLTKKQLLALIDCPLDESGYRTILEEHGITEPDA